MLLAPRIGHLQDFLAWRDIERYPASLLIPLVCPWGLAVGPRRGLVRSDTSRFSPGLDLAHCPEPLRPPPGGLQPHPGPNLPSACTVPISTYRRRPKAKQFLPPRVAWLEAALIWLAELGIYRLGVLSY